MGARDDGSAGDADLAVRAAAGDMDAFEELYRRHVQAAWRVGQAVTGNPHDAADAVSEAFTRVFQALPTRLNGGDNFRPYLLAAVRNAAIDVLRRSGRTSPTDDAEVFDGASALSQPAESLLAGVDSTMVASAFQSLPERWRSVLWLTEVEGMPPREVAGLLGISANGVAQLAVRARAGLRERYLQAHVRADDVRRDCRTTVEQLGAYVAGGLAPRDIAKVDQHLAACQACRDRVDELEDLGPTLRRAVLPLPALLAAAGAGKWLAAGGPSGTGTTGALGSAGAGSAGTAGSGAAGAGTAGSGAAGAGSAGAAAAKGGAGVLAGAGAGGGGASLSVASVALFAAGIIGVGVVVAPGLGARKGGVAEDPVVRAAPSAAGAGEDGGEVAVESPLADYPVAGVTVAGPAPAAQPVAGGGDPVAAPDPSTTSVLSDLEPLTDLGLWLSGPLGVVLALGEETGICAGARVSDVNVGCVADGDAGGGDTTVGVSTGGVLPDTEVSVPAVDEEVPVPAVKSRTSVRPSTERLVRR